MPILCQFYAKMPLRNRYFFNMGLTPPPFEQYSHKLHNLQSRTSLIWMQVFNAFSLFALHTYLKMKNSPKNLSTHQTIPKTLPKVKPTRELRAFTKVNTFQSFHMDLFIKSKSGHGFTVREGVRSRYSLSPERRKNSWQLYFNPRHQYLITRVFLVVPQLSEYI